MHYVYILESETFAGRFYTGETSDLRQRLAHAPIGGFRSAHPSNPARDCFPGLAWLGDQKCAGLTPGAAKGVHGFRRGVPEWMRLPEGMD